LIELHQTREEKTFLKTTAGGEFKIRIHDGRYDIKQADASH
jgi:hypothetical protein